MAVREAVMETIRGVFKQHGAVTIDTPVFERKEILTGKYGEDSKLIYDLQDQGGELCSLRYDLTVPFARFLAMNKQYRAMKRYHMAKVYRRDQPALARGRYREFYQCDFDIAGAHMEPMLPDAEVFAVLHGIMRALDVGRFAIKCNHRALLDGVFELAGVPAALFRATCSAVDKLDKQPWAAVRAELCAEKGVAPDAADRIGAFVQLRGGAELVDALMARADVAACARAMAGLRDLQLLFGFLRLFGIDADVALDLSLARGLDYYTGVILEVVLLEGAGRDVGSVGGGGRYDDLVGMFTPGAAIPCVGASVGIERLFTVIEARARARGDAPRASPVQVFVAAAGADLLPERIAWLQRLWAAGFCAEITMRRKVKALDQFAHCEKAAIPYALVLGPGELERGIVKIRRIADRAEREVPAERALQVLRGLVDGDPSVDLASLQL